MKEALNRLKDEAILRLNTAEDLQALQDIRVHYLGKKGALTDILRGLRDVPDAERPELGALANAIKDQISTVGDQRQIVLEKQVLSEKLASEAVDVSLPSRAGDPGAFHPLTQTMAEILEILGQLGFSVAEGPEVETEFYNFEALNIPANHPSRDMHDTFYLEDGRLLRTHTSPVQARVMAGQKPPIRVAIPGKVFRCDSDVTHSPVFHQVEGLYVDENVTFSELKGVLQHFLHRYFGGGLSMRLRPSYFPFTEPSCEVDIGCFLCKGSGCQVCKGTGFLEVMGAGMVHRNVFAAANYDSEKITGFAFGMGVERLAMLKYRVTDIRLFYENDLRFLKGLA